MRTTPQRTHRRLLRLSGAAGATIGLAVAMLTTAATSPAAAAPAGPQGVNASYASGYSGGGLAPLLYSNQGCFACAGNGHRAWYAVRTSYGWSYSAWQCVRTGETRMLDSGYWYSTSYWKEVTPMWAETYQGAC